MQRTLLLVALVLAFVLGIFVTKNWLTPAPKPQEQAAVLLEKIEAVKKLVTVEGHFSEIYNYSEYEGALTWLWDKKALVRVNATVSAGYDLNGLNFTADPATRTVRLAGMPEAKILSIEHDLRYYDLSTGIFTEFSPEDLTRLNQRAKDLIRQKAVQSNLLDAAREQGEKTLDIIKFMVESAGWHLEIGGQNALQK